MSGPGIHYIVGKKLANEIRTHLHHTTKNDVARGLENHAVYTALGTCGPDFLFFNLQDWPLVAGTGKMVKLFIDVSDTITAFKKALKECIPDALIELKESSATLSQLQDAFSEYQDVVNILTSMIQSKIIEHVTNAVDVFALMEHPIQAGHNYSKWWWFDTLHYRRTGDFAAALLKKTQNNPDSPEHAYAIGYLSHIASDVVGHPYVNLISGGPYRTQAQRHKVVESFHDVWAYKEYNPYSIERDFVYSGLHSQFHFEDPGDPPKLPDSLKELLAETIKEIYGNQFGNAMSTSDIDMAYRLWYKWFKGTTETGTPRRPEPYSLSGEVQAVWEQFVNNTENIWDLIPDSYNSGGGGLLGFLKALAAAILSPLLLGLAILDFVGGIITTISTTGFRFLMSMVYEALFNSFEKYRFAVALNGLAFPLKEHLNVSIVQHLNDPSLPDGEGRTISPNVFPKKAWKHSDPDFPSQIVFPQSDIEHLGTTGGPISYATARPSKYIDGDITFDATILKWLVRDFSWDVNDLGQLHGRMQKECLGNAVRLTKELYQVFLSEREYQPIPNFSLDGDRGIAYRCWRHDDSENPIIPLMDGYPPIKILFV